MKIKTKIIIICLISIALRIQGQEKYEMFEKEIKATANSYAKVYKDAYSFNYYTCKITDLDSLTVVVFGIKSSRYYIKQGDCEGFINDFNINKSPELEEQLKLLKEKSTAKSKRQREVRAYQDSIADIEYKNNCQYETNEIDDFNGKVRKYTDAYLITEIPNYLTVQLRNFGGNYSVVFKSSQDLGCASSYANNRSSVQVKLENGDIIKFYHSGDIDCGMFRLEGHLTNSEYSRLLKSPIDKIRLEGTDYYHDEEKIKYKDVFIDKLKCLK
tara:strand:- start:2584 stop:3396 length:813 start_codon:yes stop_codon:yes gene_type:complete